MRVETMAMVHERLYRSGDFAKIDFGEHLRELCSLVHQAQIAEGRRYTLAVAVESIEVSLDAAIPLGLIAVELLTNVFKHAFRDRSAGNAHVSLRPGADGGLVLEVRDDGVGLPPDFDLEKGRTLGLRLIRSLSRQLRAEVSISPQPGARFAINVSSQALQP
jgi:two-component sensor histidine kinase